MVLCGCPHCTRLCISSNPLLVCAAEAVLQLPLSHSLRHCAQVIILLVLSVLFLAYLRLVRPMSERSALATALGAGLLDTGSYICGIILLSYPNASSGFTCAPLAVCQQCPAPCSSL